MSKLFNKLNLEPFFFPEDVIDKAPDAKGINTNDKDDVVKFLGEEDDDEPIDLESKKKDKKEDKEDKKEGKKDKDEDKDEEEDTEEEDEDEEDDDLAELEDDLEEPDEEMLELTTPVSRREILKEFPKLFEKFPYLEKAYYREQQYTKLFPNPSDAKVAIDKADTWDKFENDLGNGDTEKMLTAVKQASPKAFNKLVDNYLETLSKVDKSAYEHVFGNITKHIIYSMVSRGKKNNDEDLVSAAEMLNKFMFNSDEYEPPKKLSTEEDKDSADNKIKNERAEFLKERFGVASSELTDRVNTIFKATIEGNIDKKDSMTPFVKKAATKEALDTLENLINRDTRFKSLVDRLWESAIENNFNKDSMDKLKKAFVSKARTLLPSVLKKARMEASRGTGKKVKDKDENDNDSEDSKDTKESSDRSSRTPRKAAKGSEIPKGMSSLEYLMQD